MKKQNSETIRPEYNLADLGKGIRGKHFSKYQAGGNLVLLSPDVAKAFPTSEDVNRALRELLKPTEKSASVPSRLGTGSKKA
ncbi:MAG: hypothetical protein K1X53_14470 [Candidatus Sumerlaeaceae bacterium]|nr:hypothetical protein [Candidatus Sumerlaeaceae bacterium]